MKEPYFLRQPGKEAIRIECPKAQIQQIASNPLFPATPRRRFLLFPGFKDAGLTEIQDETAQGLHRERRAEFLFRSLSNGLKRCLPVKLLDNEAFRFPETKVISSDRVFDDETSFACRLLPAKDQVFSQFGIIYSLSVTSHK
jgi:hypothetical protein